MTPRKIVARARERRLEMIAITDHNSVENAAAVARAAGEQGPRVLPGMELTTAEEVHLVALFGDIGPALDLQAMVYERLQPGENDENLFGLQVVANEFDEVEAMNPRLLIGATTLGVDEAVAEIHARGGLAVAAHIDRETYGIVAQLGFIPDALALDAIEVSGRTTPAAARAAYPEYAARPLWTASDAHDLDQLGSHPAWLYVAGPGFDELQLALRSEGGRRILLERPAAS